MKIEEFFLIPKSMYKEILKLIDNFAYVCEVYTFKSMPGYEFVDSYELENFLTELKQKLKQPIRVKE